MMETVCDLNMCSGCKACISVCRRNAIKIDDQIDKFNAFIDRDYCIECGMCEKVCPINNPPVFYEQISYFQGWANDAEIRKNSSSGGVASAIIKSFIEEGGFVASCEYKGGTFNFRLTSDIDSIKNFRGSKYIKSDMGNIYSEILEKLRIDSKVLFVGLPCQVAALKNRIPAKYHEKLFTIDLICHGTPSQKCLERYFSERGERLSDIKHLQFRYNNSFSLTSELSNVTEQFVADRFSISFLNGINYTDNCYNCLFAQGKRCTDLTLGDSWGSDLPDSEKSKGISLVLCQSVKGKQLIEQADLSLHNVNIQKAIEYNHQLVHPSIEPPKRKWFFDHLKKGDMKYNMLVFQLYPIICIKQKIKSILVRCRLIK